MTMDVMKQFFMWCTIINGGLFILSSVILMCAGNLVYKIHSKLFPMPRESFNAIIYSFLGFMKVIVIMFNLVPYIALAIIS